MPTPTIIITQVAGSGTGVTTGGGGGGLPPLLPPPPLPPPPLPPPPLLPPPGGMIPPEDPGVPGMGSGTGAPPLPGPTAAGPTALATSSGSPSGAPARVGRSRTGERTRSLGCQGSMWGLDWTNAPAARSPGERPEKIAAGSRNASRKAALPCSASTPAAPLGGRTASHANNAQPKLIRRQFTKNAAPC